MPTNNSVPTQPSAQERTARLGERIEEDTQSLTRSAVARVRDAREQAETGIEQQRDALATRVRRFGDSLRSSSEQNADDPLAQQLLDGASERIERVADYISSATPHDLVEDLHSLSRRQPALFFGGAFLVGLAIGRFAKSSSEAAREQPRHSQPSRSAYQPRSGYTPRAQQIPSTSTSVGGAAGVSYGAAPASAPPKPQPYDASPNPQRIEPGQGTKS